MKTMRQFGSITLNIGDGMAKGMYNISNDRGGLSMWFGEDIKDNLMEMTDIGFEEEGEFMIMMSHTQI